MTTYAVDVEAGRKPSVTLYFDHKPTDDDILTEMESKAQDLDLEGYLAEWIVSDGGVWTTTIKEF